MKYNLQARLKTDKQRGNCFHACISCILDLNSAEDVLQLQELYDNEETSWWFEIQTWLEERGWLLETMNGHPKTDEIYLVSGKSPRHIQHIVIYQNDKMIHDPQPDGSGLLPGGESNYYSLRQFKIIDSLANITKYLIKQYAKSIGLTDKKHI